MSGILKKIVCCCTGTTPTPEFEGCTHCADSYVVSITSQHGPVTIAISRVFKGHGVFGTTPPFDVPTCFWIGEYGTPGEPGYRYARIGYDFSTGRFVIRTAFRTGTVAGKECSYTGTDASNISIKSKNEQFGCPAGQYGTAGTDSDDDPGCWWYANVA